MVSPERVQRNHATIRNCTNEFQHGIVGYITVVTLAIATSSNVVTPPTVAMVPTPLREPPSTVAPFRFSVAVPSTVMVAPKSTIVVPRSRLRMIPARISMTLPLTTLTLFNVAPPHRSQGFRPIRPLARHC